MEAVLGQVICQALWQSEIPPGLPLAKEGTPLFCKEWWGEILSKA